MAPKAKAKAKPKSNTQLAAAPVAPTSTPTPQSQPQPVASISIEDLFSSLDKHIKASDFKQVIKVADQILAVAPGDEDALQCKVVAFIQVDRVDQALSLIQASQKLPIDFRFQKAYCLYRQNRLNEALEALKGMERNSSVLQLEAQILYRQGAMDVCIQNYEKLNNFMEMRMPIWFMKISTLMGTLKVTPSSSFELAYNAACALIEKNDYAEAQELLLLARRIGQEMLIEEEYTDEEIENELAPISVQLAYVQQARALVSALIDMFPDSVTPTLLQASLLVRENKINRAEEILGQFAEKHPKNSTLALLVRAQIAAASGHHLVAIESLGQITELQHRPGTVATLVSLKERAGDVDGAEAVIDAAIEWWSNNMGEDQQTLELIKLQAASLKLKHKKVKVAGDLFEQLVRSSSPVVRDEALNGLVSTTAHTDLTKAELYEKQLPPLPGLSSVDVMALEKTAGAHPTTSIGKHLRAAEDVGKRSDAGDDKLKARLKKKRKRKPRFPKGYDPANPGPPPDPERWLPKRERSTYRPKRKDRRAAQVRGSQGSVVREKPVDHAANGPSTSKSSHASGGAGKTTNSNASSEAPKPSTSGAQKSKKKSRR